MTGLEHADVLYRTIWEGQSCAAMGGKVLAIAVAVTVATFALIATFAWLRTRTLTREDCIRARRALALVFVAAFGLVIGVANHTVLNGNSLQRVTVAGGGFTFHSCAGLTSRSERVAAGDILRIEYRQTPSRGRAPRNADELVVTVRERREPFVIPLSTDPGSIDHALLARTVPRQVLAPWIAALRERGRPVPAALES